MQMACLVSQELVYQRLQRRDQPFLVWLREPEELWIMCMFFTPFHRLKLMALITLLMTLLMPVELLHSFLGRDQRF
uniref:Alternative protein GPR98 n=1 Tax=Homo sapiens TaxID=9606 RepID=L8EBA1_HUMAN|nr:alternative protein GPR98 [Homo sapiens]